MIKFFSFQVKELMVINKDTDEYKRINKLIKMFYTSNEIKYAEDYYKKYQNYKLNISKLSKKAGMECYYYNLYPYLSMSVHNQIKTLEHYYINADTNNHQFDINPHLDKETLTFIIVSSCDVIIKTLEKIYEYQNSKFPDEFKRIRIKILSIIPSN
ncbi:MAG: DUF5677 domain-containing protein [Spirochaetes bacterium]|nr:DUF5677 domain-containing protein [Spirochaetota bacterium]